MSDLDVRWLTALCLLFIGASLLFLAVRVWWMSPERRAMVFGPYMTGKGLEFMLKSWPAVFTFGLFLMVVGLSKGIYYERWYGGVSDSTANAVGLLEAIFALWAAGWVIVVAARACLGR